MYPSHSFSFKIYRNWNCYADFELIMVSKKEGVEDYVRAISHTFNKDEDDWGYSAFLMMKVGVFFSGFL